MNTAKTIRIGKTVYTINEIHACAKKWHSSDTVMLNTICDKWLKANDIHCQKPRKAVKTVNKKKEAKKSEKNSEKAVKKVKNTAPKKETEKESKKVKKIAK